MKPKKKNPQDATLRNIRALKKRVTKLETDVLFLLNNISSIFGKNGRLEMDVNIADALARLEARIIALEKKTDDHSFLFGYYPSNSKLKQRGKK